MIPVLIHQSLLSILPLLLTFVILTKLYVILNVVQRSAEEYKVLTSLLVEQITILEELTKQLKDDELMNEINTEYI